MNLKIPIIDGESNKDREKRLRLLRLAEMSPEEKRAYDAKMSAAVSAWQKTEKGKENLRRCGKRYVSKNKDKVFARVRNWTLSKKYSLTYEEICQIFQNQEGLCCICSQPMCLCVRSEGKGRICATKAFVDHDHTTGEVRGLLHSKCNSAIGMVNDSVLLLGYAIQYLSSGKSQIVVSIKKAS